MTGVLRPCPPEPRNKSEAPRVGDRPREAIVALPLYRMAPALSSVARVPVGFGPGRRGAAYVGVFVTLVSERRGIAST